ncbi:MAG: long-chain fatty acid--CoA ligase [Rhodospirillales bacterium]|nr:long-chain fatty acid--CoA ligase [Rhodospirillales bacterium]
MLLDRALAWGDRPMLRAFRDGARQATRWRDFARAAVALAAGLEQAGIAPGDRVMIVAANRPEYPIAETALMAIRAVPVPAYVTNTVADHAHILRDSGARAAIVGNARLAASVREAASRTGGLDLLICMDEAAEAGALSFAALAAGPAPLERIAAAARAIPPEALACLIYTSGTGGAPRGAMLPHRSILSNCRGAAEIIRPLGLGRGDVYLSYLPIAHSYEHTVGTYLLPALGVETVYARGVEHLAADMQTIRPTLLAAVPRVLEAVRGRVRGQLVHQPAWRQALFARALAAGLRRIDHVPRSLGERAIDPLLDHLVRAKVRARFGGRIKLIMSGAARLDPELGRFFLALGLPVMQGYGQTEAGPVISANPPGAIRIDTVGPPLPGVDLRIAEDGEILVRGDLVMAGYWGRPEDTEAVIRDGWLHTGDIGELDGGYLRITDRKKDMIVLSGGENVSPAKIEGMLVAEPEIAQAVIAGDGRAGLAALVVPAEGQDQVGVAVAVSRVNMRLSVTERIRRHALVPEFTIENGLLTPSHKVRRLLVLRAHAEALHAEA